MNGPKRGGVGATLPLLLFMGVVKMADMVDKDLAKILRRDFSEDFVAKMKASMLQSHYKYGWVSESYPELVDAIASLEKRLELYKQTGNADYLVDVANFAMIETMHPKHPSAHFRRCSSDESPGLSGVSYKQMMESVHDYNGYGA